MTEGEARSEVSREEAHGHIGHESSFSKHLRKLFAPLGLFQPDGGDVYLPPRPDRDPGEETPEEALRELQSEHFEAAPVSEDSQRS